MISAPRLPIAPSPSLFMIPIAPSLFMIPSLCWICNPALFPFCRICNPTANNISAKMECVLIGL